MTDTQAPERLWVTDIYCAGGQVITYAYESEGDVEYVRADLARPKVKPLEWEESPVGKCWAYCLTGTYYVNEAHSMGTWWWRWASCAGARRTGQASRPPGFATKEAAQAAAQAHHTRRILSALEG